MILSFVRHGQSMGNLTNDYSTDAHDQLSPLGWEQAHDLVPRLERQDLDFIYASPITRARQTITPYLQASGRTAELWPEVAEACWQDDREAPPPMRSGSRAPIAVPEDLTHHFAIRPDAPLLPWEDETFREGEDRVRNAKATLIDRHGGTGDHVLVLAHGFSGCILMELLLGIEPSRSFDHDNVGMSTLIEGLGGGWSLDVFNRTT